MQSIRHARGFTLIELLIVLAIVSTLTAKLIPAFSPALRDGNNTSQANTIVAGLILARNDAIKFGMPVNICASADGETCSGTWNDGWMVYYTNPKTDAATVVRVFPPLSANSTLTSSGGDQFTFNAIGAASATSTFTLCDDRGTGHAREVVLVPTGEVESSRTPMADTNGAAAASCS
ncbi:MAG: GspH/FimT family pseudopilin [Gammaproteobacteria bacterium]